MEELARLILKVSAEADEAWVPEGPGMMTLIRLKCPQTSEGRLVYILLTAAWNDSVNWANKVVPHTKVCRRCGDTYYASCEDSKLCPKPTCRAKGKKRES